MYRDRASHRISLSLCLALGLALLAPLAGAEGAAPARATYVYEGVKTSTVIDVRTPEEFAGGHIDGAINIPHDRIEANRPLLDKIGKDENIVVYCRSGRRSEMARQTLAGLGYRNVKNGGGLDGLTAKLKVCKTPADC